MGTNLLTTETETMTDSEIGTVMRGTTAETGITEIAASKEIIVERETETTVEIGIETMGKTETMVGARVKTGTMGVIEEGTEMEIGTATVTEVKIVATATEA